MGRRERRGSILGPPPPNGSAGTSVHVSPPLRCVEPKRGVVSEALEAQRG